MGEAKRRGTFEQRKAAALKRDAKAWKERKLAEIARRQNMTPEERAKERESANFIAVLLGIAGASVLKNNQQIHLTQKQSR